MWQHGLVVGVLLLISMITFMIMISMTGISNRDPKLAGHASHR